jgi:hypothetical protein
MNNQINEQLQKHMDLLEKNEKLTWEKFLLQHEARLSAVKPVLPEYVREYLVIGIKKSIVPTELVWDEMDRNELYDSSYEAKLLIPGFAPIEVRFILQDGIWSLCNSAFAIYNWNHREWDPYNYSLRPNLDDALVLARKLYIAAEQDQKEKMELTLSDEVKIFLRNIMYEIMEQ